MKKLIRDMEGRYNWVEEEIMGCSDIGGVSIQDGEAENNYINSYGLKDNSCIQLDSLREDREDIS